MEEIRCAACGSNELEEIEGYLVCPYCGTKHKKEKENESASLEKDSQIESMATKADMYWRHGMKAQAQRTYQLILELDASYPVPKERL